MNCRTLWNHHQTSLKLHKIHYHCEMGEITKLCQFTSKNSVKCYNNIWKKEALYALARGHGLKFIFSLVFFWRRLGSPNCQPNIIFWNFQSFNKKLLLKSFCPLCIILSRHVLPILFSNLDSLFSISRKVYQTSV